MFNVTSNWFVRS